MEKGTKAPEGTAVGAGTGAVIGGTLPAIGTAVGAFLLANWYFTPPIHTFTIAEGENLLALLECRLDNVLVRRAIYAAIDRKAVIEGAADGFGVPIGSFQAVQHGLADLPGPIDGSRLLTHKAAWAADRGDTDADRLARMAFISSAGTARLPTFLLSAST